MDFNRSLQTVLHFDKPEEICHFEWGYWPETMRRWKTEGMETENPWDGLNITFYHRVPVHTRLFPPFEVQILSETETLQKIRDERGIIKEVLKGTTAMPKWIRHPVQTLKDFEELKPQLNPHDGGRFPHDWSAQVQALRHRNSILVMGGTEISFFGWHRELIGAENLMLAYYDQPDLIHAISRHHLYFLQELYARILQDVVFDFVFLWEDMAYKSGPLVSPAIVREFMLPYYKELIGFFREFRDYKFLLDSDGNIMELIPLFMGVGVDGFLPFEVAAGMDVRRVAEQYPNLIIAGGIDKREIAKGKPAIDQELEQKLPYLFARGGYLPSMDHHVPPDISYDDFTYYIERVQQLYEKSLCGSGRG